METLKVNRQENKYLLNQIQTKQVESELSKILTKDENSKNGDYLVRSLYFDSINNIDFKTKLAGTEIRKKIRIRTYDPKSDKCKLEVKLKNGEYQKKISIWIDKNTANELIKGNYSVLFDYFNKSEDAIYIYKEMALGCYKPVALIEYDRCAFTYPEYDTRITIDKNIRTSETDFDLFSENVQFIPRTDELNVLEVKYNEKLMKFISDTLKKYNITKTSVSKYILGRPVYHRYLG